MNTLIESHEHLQMIAGHEPRVSIVMPAYNEAEIIHRVLDTLKAGGYHEIIVVDDGSTDETVRVALEHGAKVVRHPYNMGNGAAIKTGIRAASGDIIVLMDADGQHPPDEVPRMLSYIGDYDMVVGARTAKSTASLHRNMANRLFNYYATYVVGRRVADLTSGFRAVKAPLLKSMIYLLPNGYSYPSTLTIAMFRSGFRVRYEPFAAPARVGVSKIKPLRDGLRFLMTITRLAVMFAPLKIFLPVSVLFLTVGVSYGAYLLIFLRRFSNMAALLITVGIVIFLFGLIAEQISMLRMAYTNTDNR